MNSKTIGKWSIALCLALVAAVSVHAQTQDMVGGMTLPKLPGSKPRNIIFILCDDHRYDAMGFMGHPYLETPNMDRLAKEGAHFKNAFVTTSLCSPSRASILTGLYVHQHGVADNYNPVRPSLMFFPQFLQAAGYETAMVGKWHMGGDTDKPQKGFDYWLSFKGQGSYWADGHGTTRVVPQTTTNGYNFNGKEVAQKGYITDELTDYAVNWLRGRKATRPFFLYLSHKAVHSDFVPADRHIGRYKDKTFPLPKTYEDTLENYKDKPMWLKNQRNSRHGIDFAYNVDKFDIQENHRRYCETLLAVDESLGRILEVLTNKKLLDSTLIVYMGDNGFQFGEHGLIDKRSAYEASMRVPLMMRCPELFKGPTVVTNMVANVDIAPTVLSAAGLLFPAYMGGNNFLPLARGETVPWRSFLLYEYYWEHNYPMTPTMHALRSDRYKYIRYHGVWDTDEFYDLENDPDEAHNLIHDEAHQPRIKSMNKRMFDLLAETGGATMPLPRDVGDAYPLRRPGGSKQAGFPEELYSK